MKKICCLVSVIMLLSVCLSFAVGCQQNPSDVPSDKPSDEQVSQDLSMFDTKKHYGLEQVKLYKLTLLTPDASFADGNTVELAENSTLPDITYTGIGYVVGVKTVDDETVYTPHSFRMPARDLEIIVSTSTEKPPYSAVLVPGVGNNGSVAIDISSASHNAADKVGENSVFTVNPSFNVQLSERSVDIRGNGEKDVLRGCVLSLTGKTGNFVRILTGSGGAKGTEKGIQTNKAYTFTYYLENKGDTEISFKLYQAQSDIKLSGAVAIHAGRTITLAPGEHVGYTVEFVANNENGNILPLLHLQSDCTNARLGIAILKTNGVVTHNHDLQKIEAYTAQKDATSNVEYYGCDKCGGMFGDENGKKGLSVVDIFSKSIAE